MKSKQVNIFFNHQRLLDSLFFSVNIHILECILVHGNQFWNVTNVTIESDYMIE
jgi:hypothetical protein